eukprot:scaffold24995_cov46-Attheya_sp.AAC.2
MKGWTGMERTALEFRMILAGDIVRVLLRVEFCHLHAGSCRVPSYKFQAGVVNDGCQFGIHLVAMPVPFLDGILTAIEFLNFAAENRLIIITTVLAWQKLGGAFSKTHGPAHFSGVHLGHENDSRVLRGFIELGRICSGPSHDVARIFHHHCLKSQTNAQVWFFVHPTIFSRLEFSLKAPITEPSRHNDPIRRFEKAPGSVLVLLPLLLLFN